MPIKADKNRNYFYRHFFIFSFYILTLYLSNKSIGIVIRAVFSGFTTWHISILPAIDKSIINSCKSNGSVAFRKSSILKHAWLLASSKFFPAAIVIY